jgi:hypothetical protein
MGIWSQTLRSEFSGSRGVNKGRNLQSAPSLLTQPSNSQIGGLTF